MYQKGYETDREDGQSMTAQLFQNLLPTGGTVQYQTLLTPQEADHYFNLFMKETPWKNDEVVIFGKHITTKRQVAWFGESDYSYSNTTKKALPWTADLLQLKQKVEQVTGTKFNSCLLNLYHNGEEGLGWHSDDEKELGETNTIASLSLGEQGGSFSSTSKQKKKSKSHSKAEA